ncbi:MAG: protein kinase [Burkholderiales bacterium]|jgi:serine/threonine protein kinase|nr:protein kinase [Burkholderiales bacterium]
MPSNASIMLSSHTAAGVPAMSRHPEPDDDDRTVIHPLGTLPTPPRALDASQVSVNGNALPIGTVLHEFEIISVLGEGGFGIVYLAHDRSLQRRVALKEYMPSGMAARVGRTHVSLKSEHHRETFEIGLRSFVNEARLLAQFDHPSLVKVYRFWEENCTAYMAMPYYEGSTLRDRLRSMPSPPDEAWLLALLSALTEALAVIHAEQCYHRDISPDNIILLAGSGRPLLLDFGAARRVIGDMTQAFTVILKQGYAPLEQYAEVPNMKQGPWTDVYALAAVMHFAILGRTPPPAVARIVYDDYVPLATAAAGRYSARLLGAIDRALALRPEDRTRSIDDLRKDLGLGTHVVSAHASLPQAPESGKSMTRALGSIHRPSVRIVVGVAALVAALATMAFFALTGGLTQREQAAATRRTTAEAPVAAVPSPRVPPAISRTLLDEFDRIVQAGSAGFDISAVPARQQLRIGHDRLSFTLSSQRDGYVYVLVSGPDGSLMLLFPNDKAPGNRIRAGQKLVLPQSSWLLDTLEPAGPEHFLVLVSEFPRDFSSLAAGRQDWFMKLRSDAEVLSRDFSGPRSALAGKSQCQGADCDVYGAARFDVDLVR